MDGATLLEIATAAGQKNRSAVQYHFTDRRGLVEAILARHSGPVQESWIEPLALLRREGLITLPRLAALMVSSLVRHAQRDDGGREWVELCRQLLVHPRISLLQTAMVQAEGARLMAQAVTECIEMPANLAVLWSMRIANLMFHSIGDYLRLAPADLPPAEFEKDLTRAVLGILRGPSDDAG